MKREVKEMFKMVSSEIGKLNTKENAQGYLDAKDKELYNNCIVVIKELYKNMV